MAIENTDQTIDDNSPEKPSKSQIKREMHALVELGQELIKLSKNKLEQLPLDEKLADAIALAQRINSREGKRRQTHFVGKLLRQADVATIRTQLIIWQQGSTEATQSMHRLEALREALIADDNALTELLNNYPALDIQELRSHIRAARKEAQRNLAANGEPAKKHYRALFQILKQIEFKD